MSLNWKEINLILEELKLPGMHIQKVFQSTFDVLGLQVYGSTGDSEAKSRLILISTAPLACRVHETFRPLPKSAKPLRFAELLKSRIVNSRIQEAVQLGENRIVRLVLKRGEVRFFLYVRLWSNAANVILTGEEGNIIDAMKRLKRRGEISGGVYKPEDALPSGQNSKHYEVRDFKDLAAPGHEVSFNRLVDLWYAEHGGKHSLEELREELGRCIEKKRTGLLAALSRLREKERDYAGAARFKEYGSLILSAGADSTGREWLETEQPGGTAIRIELDPRKNAVQNAQAYYERYRRAKKGLEGLREEIAAETEALQRLDETEKRFLDENNPCLEGIPASKKIAALTEILEKLQKGNSAEGKNQRALAEAKKRPGLSFAVGDWLIMVGRDAQENDELLRRHVRGNDLWLHVRDWPGSYVFIRNRAGKTVPLDILLDAGNLALFYSKGRNNGKGDLYYTQVKYLRRPKNGKKGMVLPAQEKNLRITADPERLKRLESARITAP